MSQSKVIHQTPNFRLLKSTGASGARYFAQYTYHDELDRKKWSSVEQPLIAGNSFRLAAIVDELTSLLDSRWQDFATAPTERGNEIIVWREDAGVFSAIYEYVAEVDNCYWFTMHGYDDLTSDLPTHWRPLPPRPKLVEEKTA